MFYVQKLNISTGINPLDNLKIHELRTELEKRGLSTAKKRKPQLEKEFDELRRGITNVPALLQGAPEMPLTQLGLENYEISPVEPLHDIKGHLSNIIEEIRITLTGKVREEVDMIFSSALGKETLRGSDYRKGAILTLNALHNYMSDYPLTTLLSTAVEIAELLYCDPTKRTAQSILRLHNLSFVHAKLCADMFGTPKTISSRRMFGQYFHALTTHAPLLNRIISPRLLNTEIEERMFGQCKAITRTTSNQHTSHILTNILVRLDSENQMQASGMHSIDKQDSEVLKLAKSLPPKHNTVIPKTWIETFSIHYQAHLERISDYLIQGPGMWWKYVEKGVEFFDVVNIPNTCTSPSIHHFRSTTMADVDMYLLKNWEKCLDEKVQLPAHFIRTYGHTHNIRIYYPNDIVHEPDSTVTCEEQSSLFCTPGPPQSPCQPQPPHSCAPCSSQDAGQAMQTQPPLPCSSQDAGQAMETQPPLSCVPCSFQDAGQAMQIQPPLYCAPCSSRKDMQTITSIQHSPQEPDQQNLPCTPCFSGKGQPMQTKPSLMSTPCSSHATRVSAQPPNRPIFERP